ncbi:MAG: hypothetical protein U5L45_23520 [Saprospiraceae bacterium]|nr:hypothetical protein [Saprospiraceae bacterium]
MIIANPLYDVVFKYLLEDTDIARELLSTILNEPITHLEVKPQETVTEGAQNNLNILRFDFKATIETPTGDIKKVLIELQKLKQNFDIMRFRRYLGDNYKKEDTIPFNDGTSTTMPLPIVTIYILGFVLNKMTNAAVKINREYRDILTNTPIFIKEEFIELLTHDSYVIQVLSLPPDTKTKLERVLQIFNPKFRTKDQHKLDFTGNVDEPIVQKMVNRLQRAIIDEEVRHIMDVEDEIERAFARATAAKDLLIAEQEQIISNQEQALETERQQVALLMQQLEELQKQNRT